MACGACETVDPLRKRASARLPSRSCPRRPTGPTGPGGGCLPHFRLPACPPARPHSPLLLPPCPTPTVPPWLRFGCLLLLPPKPRISSDVAAAHAPEQRSLSGVESWPTPAEMLAGGGDGDACLRDRGHLFAQPGNGDDGQQHLICCNSDSSVLAASAMAAGGRESMRAE